MIPIRFWSAMALLSLAILMGLQQTHRREAKSRIGEQVQAISRLNWICYAPTHYDPKLKQYPTTSSMRSDLETLRAVGFDGVITYECRGQFEQIPELARQVGLKVIQGVWGPADREELRKAVRVKDKVVAYCVGNDGLGNRYTIRELDQGLTYLSNQTGIPTTLSEQIQLYFEHPDLIDMGDWLFPIAHPHFSNAKSLETAVQWLDGNTRRLARSAEGRGLRKVLFAKEIGMPSEGDSAYSEVSQARFLEYMLEQPKPAFALFEAFDRKGWEYISSVEPHWGVFRSDRTPKQAALFLRQILAARKRLLAANSALLTGKNQGW